MKISNILIAFLILFSVACDSKSENGHEHGTAEGEHTHNQDANHEEQEEFKVSETDSTVQASDSTTETEFMVITKQQENEVTITVPAKKGVEYKFYLKQYEKLAYEWTAETPLYFDFHGEPLDYETTKYFESFTEATSNNMKGIMTVPFEGSHGWYWKNNSDKDVIVTLKTKGNYKVLGLKQ
ncbi:MAG: hypothetical protein ACI8QD_001778 [Cyclobacteriaceae bacterium]|jgi:hypothetical protein